MKTSAMTPSKYLKKEQVAERPLRVTIRDVVQENLAKNDEPEEKKWILYFREHDQGLVLNNTNIALCELACGSDETDDWMGKQIVLYNDPTIVFAGRRTGGIRIRPATGGAKASTPKQRESIPATPPTDDVPWPNETDAPF
jgi:hypothetical protein